MSDSEEEFASADEGEMEAKPGSTPIIHTNIQVESVGRLELYTK